MKWIGKSIKGPIIIYKGEFKLWGGGGGGGWGARLYIIRQQEWVKNRILVL